MLLAADHDADDTSDHDIPFGQADDGGGLVGLPVVLCCHHIGTIRQSRDLSSRVSGAAGTTNVICGG